MRNVLALCSSLPKLHAQQSELENYCVRNKCGIYFIVEVASYYGAC